MPTPAEVIFSTPCYIKRKVESKQYILNWRLTFHVTSCVKRQNMFRGWHSRWRESCTWCRGATHQGESFLTISHVQHCRRPNITLQVFCESESYSIAVFSLTLKIFKHLGGGAGQLAARGRCCCPRLPAPHPVRIEHRFQNSCNICTLQFIFLSFQVEIYPALCPLTFGKHILQRMSECSLISSVALNVL